MAESVSERELRSYRKLTSEGEQQFQQSNERHQYKLRNIKRDIDVIILDVEDNPVLDLSLASKYWIEISKLTDKFEKEANGYIDFLTSYRTEESGIEQASFKVTFSALRAKVSVVTQHLSALLPKISTQESEPTLKSHSSHHSSRRSSSHSASTRNSSLSAQSKSEILKQTVKLETAKTRLKYAKEEAELLHREATLKAERNVLSMKREVEEAESGLQAVKKALDYDLDDYGQSYEPPRIANPVVQHADIDRISEGKYYSPYVLDTHKITEQRTAEFVDQQRSQHNSRLIESDFRATSVKNAIHSLGPLNPTARPFVPTQRSEAQELAKFMVKKNLITSRLMSFDDQPSHYSSWKLSFKHIMTELDTNPLEQLDLLIKYLGPSSKQHAQNIRCANANYPATAVRLIWERLDARFGSPEMIESSLHSRIVNFPKLTNNNRKELYELADLAAEIESIRKDEKFATTFAYFDSSLGVNRFVSRLPYNIQEKWTTTANGYKSKNNGAYPPFSFFVSFLQNIAKVRNDPGFLYDNQDTKPTTPKQTGEQNRIRRPAQVSSIKTDIGQNVYRPPIQKPNEDSCPLHGTNHKLNMCRGFRAKPLSERLDLIKQKGLCFKCCGPKKHFRDKCKEDIKCSVCGSRDHPSALHVDIETEPQIKHEGEKSKERISSSCTKICDSINNTSKSCAKIVLAKVYHSDRPEHFKTVYCVIDDQSNRTLATSDFFNFFGEHDTKTEYVLSSCAGRFVSSGRRASGYVLASLDGSSCLNVPEIIECNDIPNNREEIPSSVVASSYPHMLDIANCIPDIDKQSEIQLLIGRDLIRAHHVLEHRVGVDEVPYAQRLPLGWVIVGNVCLGRFHGHEVVNVNKTVILGNGRPTILSPCDSEMSVRLDPIFDKTKLDEREGMSIEDQTFVNIMSSGFLKQEDGHWIAPLPFKPNKLSLENNKQIAERRAKSFDMNLRCNSVKRAHVVDFMQKLFDREHAQIAPKLTPDTECWYLPMFAVYHPRKPESVRVVFDSSAKHHGLSLNDVLLKGPDIYNSLLGILLRFRKESYAVTVDIEQMFHNFRVIEEHRRFLRFLWHENNEFDKPLTEYQMLVHVFGNSPSPAVATYGLRRTVQCAELDVKDFVSNDFYVDDGLTSCATPEGVIDLVQRTKQALYENGRLRLHKVASNSRLVLEAFHSDDLAKNLKDLDLGSVDLPMQRSLGLSWDTELDEFTFRVSSDIKPFTRRGVLSTINSLYDPIGFAAPVIIRGKLLMRQMLPSSSTYDWDDPLPESLNQQWESWVHSLSELEHLRIPRKYNGPSFAGSVKREVHIFSDASKDAIAAVAYLKLYSANSVNISFLIGKAKVAPPHGHTIPRLELCAAVLAVEVSDIIRDQLNINPDDFYYYTDSRVVLGYLTNETRRFYIYVGNRVSRIRSSCQPTQWSHVSTNENPADLATRSISTSDLPASLWIKGPDMLLANDKQDEHDHLLVDPENDKELRPFIECKKTEIKAKHTGNSLETQRFEIFSEWTRLVKCIVFLKSWIRSRRHSCNDISDTSSVIKDTETLILRAVQNEVYKDEMYSLREGKNFMSRSSLSALSPILGTDGLLRVGGRLKNLQDSGQGDMSQHPVILPKNHHISLLIVRHFHASIHHQGRHLTEGAIRAGGFWIIGSKRLVASVIYNCVTCRKLRGKFEWQKMADLPKDRLNPSPPFSYVGVDTFGPWPIMFRRTRGGAANQKRWAILFTCLVTRAVHIEVVEELSSSSFINALRRFIAIRGPVVQFRSDRGTNFVGATSDLSIQPVFIEREPMKGFLLKSGVTWLFNPPYAHHMGGPWERLIGVARRILDAMLLENKCRNLTHEVLVTLMAEVTAIINNRPLLSVSTDPECPSVLSPSALLTMKTSPDVKPFPSFSSKDMLKAHWKHVQGLSEEFWRRWNNEYLHELQTRSKWHNDRRNLEVGDVVLMKDQDSPRNVWPLGLIEKTFPSSDGKVRKVEVTVIKDGKRATYTRPLTELVTLLEVD